jgi:predicted flap endonuclease-1-like 5' DNA nuclease
MTPAAVFEPEPLPELDIPELPVRVVEPEPAAMMPDNLKRIEGIGPRIESLLNSAGITTFQQLSDTPVERLREIMIAAELRGSFGDPTTWPEQARLAAAGSWDELKTMQDGLKGGHQK